jgi:hypothetical protein
MDTTISVADTRRSVIIRGLGGRWNVAALICGGLAGCWEILTQPGNTRLETTYLLFFAVVAFGLKIWFFSACYTLLHATDPKVISNGRKTLALIDALFRGNYVFVFGVAFLCTIPCTIWPPHQSNPVVARIWFSLCGVIELWLIIRQPCRLVGTFTDSNVQNAFKTETNIRIIDTIGLVFTPTFRERVYVPTIEDDRDNLYGALSQHPDSLARCRIYARFALRIAIRIFHLILVQILE